MCGHMWWKKAVTYVCTYLHVTYQIRCTPYGCHAAAITIDILVSTAYVHLKIDFDLVQCYAAALLCMYVNNLLTNAIISSGPNSTRKYTLTQLRILSKPRLLIFLQ